MVLHNRILFSLASAAIAEAILMRTSTELVLSLHSVAPRYLKLVISSNWSSLGRSCWSLHWCCSYCWSWSFCFLCWLPIHMPLLCLRVYWWGFEVHYCCRPQDRCRRQIVGCIWAFHQWKWMCGCHGVFPAWSSLETSWTGWVRVSLSDGRIFVLKNSPSWPFKRTALLKFSYSAPYTQDVKNTRQRAHFRGRLLSQSNKHTDTTVTVITRKTVKRWKKIFCGRKDPGTAIGRCECLEKSSFNFCMFLSLKVKVCVHSPNCICLNSTCNMHHCQLAPEVKP